MTPEEMADCAASGRYWFLRTDGSCYGSPVDAAQNEGDVRLGDFPESWVQQWESWEQAAAVMDNEGLFARLNGRRT